MAIESLHRQFPNKFLTDVQTSAGELWQNNPNITKLNHSECEIIQAEYPLINSSNEIPIHFGDAFCRDIGGKLKVNLTLQVNRPYLFLSPSEKNKVWFNKPYGVVNCGYKNDYTAKHIGYHQSQKVIDAFQELLWVQVGSLEHNHRKLVGSNVIDMVGKTSIRDLCSLVNGSVIGFGACSLLHHIHAAFSKPFVLVLGGREPRHWEAYPTEIVLDTFGQMECCATKACWKSRTVPLRDKDEKNNSLCSFPVLDQDEWVAGCMKKIGSEGIIQAVRNMVHLNKILCL